MIKLILPDGSIKKYKKFITPIEIAKSINECLYKNIISALINNKEIEVNTPLVNDGKIEFLTWHDSLGKKAFWNSSAHLLGEAILYYYPQAKLTIGLPIEQGFYYDIDFNEEIFQEKDFKKIEFKILENAKKHTSFRTYSVTKDEALSQFKDNIYKIELINQIEDKIIHFCSHDNFIELCKGIHIPSTGFIKSVKILNISGVYWKNDSKNKQLTRIYAISFPKREYLSKYISNLEEIKKKDHRQIGKKLEIFTFSKKVGLGLPMWLPKGALIRKKIENLIYNIQKKNGYEMVITPHIGNKNLYITSGHYEKYQSDSFQSIKSLNKDEEFILKPMNCPHHCEIYKNSIWTYKDLPKRFAEFGTVYRYEQSGELHGLTRVRGFTQDDAHIFCTPDQLLNEIENIIELTLYLFQKIGFKNYKAQISLRDKKNRKKYIGLNTNWDKAEEFIIQASKNKKLNTIIEYGEAAFYGPKLDFMFNDTWGRKWQLGTIQIDYNLPERFKLFYIGNDGEKTQPIMIHRAFFGSIERLIAILIEHTSGNFPLWLSPNPLIILPISEKYIDYAKKVVKKLEIYDIWGSIDQRNEKIGKKVRDAEVDKYPLMLIIGEEEKENQTISLRRKGVGNIGQMTIKKFLKYYNNIVKQNL